MIAVLLAGAAALVAFDEIDRWIAGLFFNPDDWFLGNHPPFPTLRYATTIAGWGVGAFVVAGMLWRILLGRPYFGLSRGAIVYLLIAFLVGPALIANSVFKENWGRARPGHIEQFGGTKQYTPPLAIADQCETNCSFVSGEASLGFAFMAFGFLAATRERRRLGIAAGIGLGMLFGLIRIAEGGHFFSDVYFGALFMALVCWSLERLFRWRGWL